MKASLQKNQVNGEPTEKKLKLPILVIIVQLELMKNLKYWVDNKHSLAAFMHERTKLKTSEVMINEAGNIVNSDLPELSDNCFCLAIVVYEIPMHHQPLQVLFKVTVDKSTEQPHKPLGIQSIEDNDF